MKIIKDSNGKILTNNGAVYALTASADPNIAAGNIVKGIDIFGVAGSVTRVPIVTFVDYDGTVLYRFTAQSFAALTAMPDAPGLPSGYTSLGWNWSLADAKEYVAAHGDLIIGHVVRTGSGTTVPYDSNSQYIVYSADMLQNGTTIDEPQANIYAGAIGMCLPKMTNIAGSAFFINNTQRMLETLFMPGTITSLGGNAFYYSCSKLKHITLPDGITAIPNACFYGCSALEEITIPANVASIGTDAFNGCSSMRVMRSLAATPPTIQSNSFSTPNVIRVYVPAGSVAAYKTAWTGFSSIIFADPSIQ